MARDSIYSDDDRSTNGSAELRLCSGPTYSKKLVPAKPSRQTRRLSYRLLRTLMVLAAIVVLVGFSSAVVVARILIPAAATAVAVGVTGLASLSAQGGIYALEHGDADLRKQVLQSILEMDRSQLPQPMDEASSAAILRALNGCKSDCDPEVVRLAFEVEQMLFSDIKDGPSVGEI